MLYSYPERGTRDSIVNGEKGRGGEASLYTGVAPMILLTS